MSEAKARRVVAEAARRAESLRRVDFGKLCFPEQRAFVEDDSNFVAGICGRRAGKSDGAVLKCLRSAQRYPGAVVPYIALSRPHAKRIAWPKFLLWDRKLNLGCRFNHAELTMTFPRTGSQIVLGGANDESEIERYRGGAYPTVVIDEAQAFRSFLPSFVVEILMPALLDYDGQLVLIGTPNPHCYGLFHDATNTGAAITCGLKQIPDFSVHRWTGLDNPNIDRAYREGEHDDREKALERTRAAIDKLSAAAGLRPGDPAYQREWLGEWIRDAEGLVYRVNDWNVVHELPDDVDDWRYVLGMDVGFVDATAFVVFAYSKTKGAAYVVESFQKTEMLPSQQAAAVNRLWETYDFESIVIDPGGGGKGLVEELAQRHGLPARTAEKREKIAAIETLNGDLRANTVRIVGPTNGELLHDLSQLKWDYARLAKKGGAQWKLKPITHLAIDDRTPDHLADAFLYGHRECLHYMNEYDVDGPKPGTQEWIKKIEDELLAKAEARVDGKDDVPWWERPPPA